MNLPDLAQEIAWWKTNMRPSDPAFGAGLSDWTITAEYVPDLETPEHGRVWGLTCSPSCLPEIRWLTPEDIEAKRAHFQIREPKTADEVEEIEETLPHELVHVLDARKSGTVEDKENTAHSLAPLLAALRKNHPARAAMLARAIANPAMARAYRAKEGTMPDVQEEKKEPDKAPMAQEGGEMSVEDIKAALVKAVLDGQPTEELAKKLVAAMATQGTTVPASPSPVAPEVPTMGMKPEEAAARKMVAEERKEAIEAILDANPHLDDKQKAMARKQSSVKDARELVASYARPASPEKPKMGMQENPKLGGKPEAPLARAIAEAEGDEVFRRAMGLGSAKNDGIHYDVPGHIVYVDGSERLRHQRNAYRNRRAA